MEEYLKRGPGFVFLYHPALGPLWEVIGQKLRGGRLARGAEVLLEVAEAQVCRGCWSLLPRFHDEHTPPRRLLQLRQLSLSLQCSPTGGLAVELCTS